MLNPLIISQTKQNEEKKKKKNSKKINKKGTQALDYGRVTSQARGRHGDSAKGMGDTYPEREREREREREAHGQDRQTDRRTWDS